MDTVSRMSSRNSAWPPLISGVPALYARSPGNAHCFVCERIFDDERRFTSGQSRQPREARAERRKRGLVRGLGAKKEKKKGKDGLRFRQSRLSLRTSALLSCGSPQGHWFAEGISPPFEKCWCVRHSLHLATTSSWGVTRSSCRSARRGIEPSRVPRRDGRRSIGRVCRRRGDPTASPRTFADAPLLARTLPRSDPIPPPSARGFDRGSIPCLGGRLRPRASSSRAPRF